MIITALLLFIWIEPSSKTKSSIKEDDEIWDKNPSNTEVYIEDKETPISSAPTDITFSTVLGSPTPISTGVWYRTTQMATLYIQVTLNSDELYLINTEGWSEWFTLYRNSDFTGEIKYTDDKEIVYSPVSSGTYYLKWLTDSPFEKFIGVWQATKYTKEDVRAGISIIYDNADWGRAVIFFISPSISGAADKYDLEINVPAFTKHHLINLNSDEAYNTNELEGLDLREDLYNNPEKGFFMSFEYEGTFQVTIKESTSPPSSDDEDDADNTDNADDGFEISMSVVILILSIIACGGGLGVFLIINHRYLRIGHRIQKKRRESKEEKDIHRKIDEAFEPKKKRKGKKLKDIHRKIDEAFKPGIIKPEKDEDIEKI